MCNTYIIKISSQGADLIPQITNKIYYDSECLQAHLTGDPLRLPGFSAGALVLNLIVKRLYLRCFSMALVPLLGGRFLYNLYYEK
jgi:hypothetical protein